MLNYIHTSSDFDKLKMIKDKITDMCNEPDGIPLDRNMFTEKKKQIFTKPTVKELPTEIADIAALKNQQKEPELTSIARTVRSVYPDTVYYESACLMNSKFKVDTKDKLSNALKD